MSRPFPRGHVPYNAGRSVIDTWPARDRARLVRDLATRSTHELARAHGIGQATLYNWATRHGICLSGRAGGARLSARARASG